MRPTVQLKLNCETTRELPNQAISYCILTTRDERSVVRDPSET